MLELANPVHASSSSLLPGLADLQIACMEQEQVMHACIHAIHRWATIFLDNQLPKNALLPK